MLIRTDERSSFGRARAHTLITLPRTSGCIGYTIYRCPENINHLACVTAWEVFITHSSHHKGTCRFSVQGRLSIKAPLQQPPNWQQTHGDPCLSFQLSMLTLTRQHTLLNKQALVAKQTFCSSSGPTFLYLFATQVTVYLFWHCFYIKNCKRNYYAGSSFFFFFFDRHLKLVCLTASFACLCS